MHERKVNYIEISFSKRKNVFIHSLTFNLNSVSFTTEIELSMKAFLNSCFIAFTINAGHCKFKRHLSKSEKYTEISKLISWFLKYKFILENLPRRKHWCFGIWKSQLNTNSISIRLIPVVLTYRFSSYI